MQGSIRNLAARQQQNELQKLLLNVYAEDYVEMFRGAEDWSRGLENREKATRWKKRSPAHRKAAQKSVLTAAAAATAASISTTAAATAASIATTAEATAATVAATATTVAAAAAAVVLTARRTL
jgi:hypothetical protein